MATMRGKANIFRHTTGSGRMISHTGTHIYEARSGFYLLFKQKPTLISRTTIATTTDNRLEAF